MLVLSNHWQTVCIITPKSYHTLNIDENIPIHTYDCIKRDIQTCNIPITCPKLIGNMLRCNQYCNNFDESRFQWMVDMQSKFSIWFEFNRMQLVSVRLLYDEPIRLNELQIVLQNFYLLKLLWQNQPASRYCFIKTIKYEIATHTRSCLCLILEQMSTMVKLQKGFHRRRFQMQENHPFSLVLILIFNQKIIWCVS